MITTPYMMIRGRRTRVLRLRCDAHRRAISCHSHEEFADFKGLKLTEWLRSHGWRSIHRGGALYDHHCPACAIISRTSTSYAERLQA